MRGVHLGTEECCLDWLVIHVLQGVMLSFVDFKKFLKLYEIFA